MACVRTSIKTPRVTLVTRHTVRQAPNPQVTAPHADLAEALPEARGHVALRQFLENEKALGRVPHICGDGVSEPDPDRGDVDGASVDEVALDAPMDVKPLMVLSVGWICPR